MTSIIDIEHATVRRDERIILDDVSLKVRKGERIALIGPNGAGKSTLVDVISRRTYPLKRDEYRNAIFGEERWIIQDLKPRLGIVSPSYEEFFITTYSVREIVASGLFSSLGFDFHHIVGDEIWQKADLAIERSGLSGLSKRAMNTLSTGEKRKVLLARAAITGGSVRLLHRKPFCAASRQMISARSGTNLRHSAGPSPALICNITGINFPYGLMLTMGRSSASTSASLKFCKSSMTVLTSL